MGKIELGTSGAARWRRQRSQRRDGEKAEKGRDTEKSESADGACAIDRPRTYG